MSRALRPQDAAQARRLESWRDLPELHADGGRVGQEGKLVRSPAHHAACLAAHKPTCRATPTEEAVNCGVGSL